MKRHGGLLSDEMKLSANLDMKSSTHIEGFDDIGQFTDLSDKRTKADHGLVMFQPLVGSWTQIIGQTTVRQIYMSCASFFCTCICFQWKCEV